MGRIELDVKEHDDGGFLISIFFISVFTKIYFRYGNLQKYIPAARLPGGRDPAAGRQRIFRKKTQKIIADRPLGPVARLPGGRPPTHI